MNFKLYLRCILCKNIGKLRYSLCKINKILWYIMCIKASKLRYSLCIMYYIFDFKNAKYVVLQKYRKGVDVLEK